MTLRAILAIIASGSALALGAIWWLALGIGVGIYFYRRAAPTKILFILDSETGQMTAQPADKAAQKYLESRD